MHKKLHAHSTEHQRLPLPSLTDQSLPLLSDQVTTQNALRLQHLLASFAPPAAMDPLLWMPQVGTRLPAASSMRTMLTNPSSTASCSATCPSPADMASSRQTQDCHRQKPRLPPANRRWATTRHTSAAALPTPTTFPQLTLHLVQVPTSTSLTAATTHTTSGAGSA